MSTFILVWLLSALVVIAVVYLVKSLRRHRPARLGNFHWPGMIVIGLIVGAFPAFIYYIQTPRAVSVPDGVAERPKISEPAKN